MPDHDQRRWVLLLLVPLLMSLSLGAGLHISLSWAGGRGETSWYDGRLG